MVAAIRQPNEKLGAGGGTFTRRRAQRIGARSLWLLSLLLLGCEAGGSEVRLPRAPQTPSPTEVPGQLDETRELLRVELFRLKPDRANVTVTGDDYAIVHTHVGPFAVVGKGAQRHLDGYKVRLALGNLTTAVVHGVRVTAVWGPEYREGSFEDVVGVKQKQFEFTDAFRPGRYRTIELFVAPATAREIRTLDVGIDVNRISLRDG